MFNEEYMKIKLDLLNEIREKVRIMLPRSDKML